MSNRMYRRINSVDWKHEARLVKLGNDEMSRKIDEAKASRKRAKTKTQRRDFTEETYGLEMRGDWARLYMYEGGEYVIYASNAFDDAKNVQEAGNPDWEFDRKFKELNGVSLRKAFGFVDKSIKRCVPKQFYWLDRRLLGKTFVASSIDATSQYPSGCLGMLPDAHRYEIVEGYAKPTEEYPFAFYSSGHLAIYGELDTHDWIDNKLMPYLFRIGQGPYDLKPGPEEKTILCAKSDYTMDSTWRYFYDIKAREPEGSAEYQAAKLMLNGVIGRWHRKDKERKTFGSYDSGRSYQMAHIAAVCIARGNQKMLDKIAQIGLMRVAHVCVDGIIYRGSDRQGLDHKELGEFSQEFVGCDFKMVGMNQYCATDRGAVIKFRHGGCDLIRGEKIDDSKVYGPEDLNCLGKSERLKEKIDEEIQG